MEANSDERLEEVLCHAVQIESADERARFLDEACAGNVPLRANVDRLIGNHFAARNFLQHPAVGATQVFSDTADDSEFPKRTAPQLDDVSLDFLKPARQPRSLGRLGQYEVLEVVGRGGMGIVLKAQDTRLNRLVAVKVLAPELAANVTARQRFLREAQAAAAVSHDHVVTIYAVVDNERQRNHAAGANIPYLVMEFIDGQSLQQRLDRRGPLELKEILRIGHQIASGLSAAHAQGLIHRDIKPSNILLQNGVERLQITDFGLARAVDDASVTQTGMITGTPAYMSPEQARGDAVDHRSDLFSLGSVMYTMCAGQSPFCGSTSLGVLKRVNEEAPRPISDVSPDIPQWLRAIVERLHAKRPDERFQSAAELADVLGRCLASLQSASKPLPMEILSATAPQKPGIPRTARSSRRNRLRWVAAAVAALVILGVALSLTDASGMTHIAATVMRIFTPDGTLIVEVDDPGVKVTIEGDGGLVITGAGAQEVRVRPGSYQVHASKDGKPVQLDRELVTISRGSKQVVKIRVEGAPIVAVQRKADDAFVLLAAKGVAERKFATLAEAVQSAGYGDTIEIRGNGPFDTPPIAITHQLTVRAGVGFRPILQVTQGNLKGTNDYPRIVDCKAALTLEGLELHVRWHDEGEKIHTVVNGDFVPVRMANCRLICHTPPDWSIVSSDYSTIDLRNCELLGCTKGSCVNTNALRPPSSLVIDNSILVVHRNGGVGGCAIGISWQNGSSAGISRSTIVSGQETVAFFTLKDESQTVKRFDFKIEGNVLKTLADVYVFKQYDAEARFAALADVEPLLLHTVQLREDHNLYGYQRRIVAYRSWKYGGSTSLGGRSDLAEWCRVWDREDDIGQKAEPRFEGGDLLARLAKDAASVTPEDFRLRAGSPGYRAGPDGKDLGADVDLVGPGEAYERWKHTPQYQAWREETEQVTIAAAEVREEQPTQATDN